MKPAVYQFLVGCFAALGSFLFGYDLAVIAEVVASGSFAHLFLQKDGDSKSGTVVALFTGGCFVGAFAAGWARRLGRRDVIFAASCIFIVGGAIQTGGVVIAMLYVGRLIAGIGIGLLVMIIPIFQAEIAHRKIRGRITTLQQLFSAIGQVVASWVGYGCYITWNDSCLSFCCYAIAPCYFNDPRYALTLTPITISLDSRAWRVPLAIQIVPCLFLGSLIYIFPESPRWLCDHDRPEQGLRNLARLHAHGDITDAYVVAEFNLIQTQIAEEHSQKAKTYFDLFRGWPNLRRTIIVMMIQAGCQMTGISAIQYFSPQIFRQIGIPTTETLLLQAVNFVIGLVGTSITVVIIDTAGRRPIEIIGAAIMGITFMINTILIALFPASVDSTGAHWGFIVMTWLFTFVFFISSGPLSWAIPPELFSTAYRIKGVSLGCMTSFAWNTMVGQVTPIAISSIGWKYYLVFTITNFTNGLFFWAFLPETKGLNLEDMDELFRESPTFVPGSKWQPSSHIDRDAEDVKHGNIGKLEANVVETLERADI